MGDLRLTLLLLMVVGLQESLSQDPKPVVYRLPSTITPRLYTLRLEPSPDLGQVNGTIRIEVSTHGTNETLTSIALHYGANGTVNATSAAIIDMDGTVMMPGAVSLDDENSLLILELKDGQALKLNYTYVISLHFTSPLGTSTKGLFYGYYNSTSKYIASNFRPVYAREVFPCFDEPQFKVPVSLQVVRPTSYYSLSTAGSPTSEPLSDDKVLDTFPNTGPISIHSLGIFISQVAPVSSMGVKVVVPPSLPVTIDWLNILITNVVKQYGKFPQSPLNLIVLPDKTLTTFSSLGFVFTSPEVYQGTVGSILQWTSLQLKLTEEFLRQYLEFSKTPQWWSELWLSESVGAYLAIPFQQGETPLQDWLKIVVRSEALGGYTSPSGAVITAEDLTKWDIENIISNQTIKLKGLSTLLMWQNTMAVKVVQKTLSDFIKLEKSVVTTTDLVNIMVKYIKQSKSYNCTAAIPLLPNWISQPCSPLVNFAINSNSTYNLAQETPWCTPAERSISVAIAVGQTPKWNNFRQGNWLLDTSANFTWDNISEASVINIETAPFRVNYPVDQWNVLINALSTGWAPLSVASALQDDAVALSLQGFLDFSVGLSVLNSTDRTSLDLGWWPIVKATEAISAKLGNSYYGLSAFGKYFADLFSADLLAELDLNNSANYTNASVVRELVTPWLCRFNIGTCRTAVVNLGASLWQGNTSNIAPSDLENVACYGARYTPGALGPLLTAYQNATDMTLRRYFTIALSCLTDQDSVNNLLYTIVNSQTTFKAQDSAVSLDTSDAEEILVGLASSVENAQTVLTFLLSEGLDVQERFGVGTLSSVIKSLANNRANLTQLSSLQNQNLAPYVIQSVEEALVTATSSQTWYSTYSSQLYKALPAGDIPPTTAAASTTPGLTTVFSTPTPTPGGHSAAAGLTDFRVFTTILTALMITLDFMLR
ncbi:thyrotropin-releasing hormone-degrading ectoenzyme-like [Macrosteles quadrilineatus]|uniref:thyrotropin-releasing hormone-degrading ectoenzyme-like n=1 Tax=Macrosteles quadrilineatus TaxID=74068 RepID=UPI0023E182BD|nr:thyrotropin-releasing hormone-degrading ectoenzyme-like [Macrosteles quadrilineatus]